MKSIPLLAAALLAWSSASAQTPTPAPAQTPQADSGPPASAIASPPATPNIAGARLTANTPVLVALDQQLSSNTAKRGDKFPIELAAAIVIDGRTVAPAGAKGMGEVVYADPSGGGGTPGKLVLAARYIDVDGVRIKLKALNLSAGGDSDFRSLALASSIVSVGVFLINGGEVRYPVGTKAGAKVAEEVVFPAPSTAPSAGAPAVTSPATPADAQPPSAQQEETNK